MYAGYVREINFRFFFSFFALFRFIPFSLCLVPFDSVFAVTINKLQLLLQINGALLKDPNLIWEVTLCFTSGY